MLISTNQRSLLTMRVRLIFILLLVLVPGITWLADQIDFGFFLSCTEIDNWMVNLAADDRYKAILIGGLLYILLLMIPFVPGFELGLLIMLLLGGDSVWFIYLFTIIGLNLSFLLGKLLISKQGSQLLEYRKVPLSSIRPLFLQNKLGLLIVRKFANRINRNRYLLLGLLFNLPGNYALGGGGGIALLSAGLPNISWRGFMLTVCVAVSPVPCLIAFTGISVELLR